MTEPWQRGARPRILFVSSRLPQPLDSGLNIRTRHLLDALAAAGDVHWLGYGFRDEFAAFASDCRETASWLSSCSTMRALPLPPWPAFTPGLYEQLMCKAVLARRSPYYASFPIEPLRGMVARMAPCSDLIFVGGLFLAEALDLPALKTLVDINDLEEAKIARRAHVASGWGLRWALRREAARLGAVESQAPTRFARLSVCSETDAARWPDAADRIWVVPNGADDSLFGRKPVAKIPYRLVFVGTMTYGPNEDALMYFVSEILPSLIVREPRVSLSIVGKSPSARVQRLHDGIRVFVYADVPDVAPRVQEAVASIVPLRVAGGTRLKILESLALRTPVVSTAIGAEGLDLRDGQHLLLADTATDFVEAVARLLQDPQTAEQIGRDGAARVHSMYRWSTIRRRLSDHVEDWAATLALDDRHRG